MSTQAAGLSTRTLTRAQAEDVLFLEARLLDQLRLEEWLDLYTPEAVYWIPIDEHAPVSQNVSIVYDTPLRRQERVYHQLKISFPAQTPRSRLLHVVSNVIVEPGEDRAVVHSSQLIYEMRKGDFTQIGLGDPKTLAADVEHELVVHEGRLRIANKKILLMNRDTWQGNMTFII
jgi:3-phenylpropionate/cinnamic acid dioxygenase small subunit